MQTVTIAMVSSVVPHLIYMQKAGDDNVCVTSSVLTTERRDIPPQSQCVATVTCHCSHHQIIDTLQHSRCGAVSSKEDASSMFFTLKLEAAYSSEESVTIYQTTRRRVPKDNNRQWLSLCDALSSDAISCRIVGICVEGLDSNPESYCCNTPLSISLQLQYLHHRRKSGILFRGSCDAHPILLTTAPPAPNQLYKVIHSEKASN
jgi:hypothetical protein